MKDRHAKYSFILLKITADIKVFLNFFEVHVYIHVQENYSDSDICYFAFWQEYWVEIKNKTWPNTVCHQDEISALQSNQVRQGIICQKQLTARCLNSYVIDNIKEKKIFKIFKFQGQWDVTQQKGQIWKTQTWSIFGHQYNTVSVCHSLAWYSV